MSNRGPKWRFDGSLFLINVNPLMVIRRPGEIINHGLSYLFPIGWAKFNPDMLLQLVQVLESFQLDG